MAFLLTILENHSYASTKDYYEDLVVIAYESVPFNKTLPYLHIVQNVQTYSTLIVCVCVYITK